MRWLRYPTTLWALAGFLFGSALLAGGQEDEEDLAERLRELQILAAKSVARSPLAEKLPPAGEPGVEFEAFPCADLLMYVPRYIRPAHEWLEDDDVPLFGGIAEEGFQPFGTIEELAELLRFAVSPDAWERPDGVLTMSRATILMQHTPALIDETQRFLDEALRPRAHRTVSVHGEILELPAELASKLLASGRKELTDEERAEVIAAIDGESGRRIFAGRVLSLLDQPVLLWHGRQVALVEDADVEVAEGSETSDPVVGVEQVGGVLFVRTVAGPKGTPLSLEVDLDFEEMDEKTREQETRDAMSLQLPVKRVAYTRARIQASSGRWAIAGAQSAGKDKMRVVLVKATVLERPAPARGGGR